MEQLERIESDLRFVRRAVDGSVQPVSPAALYFLWAVIVLVGFALNDFGADAVPQYWAVAAPAGFIVSAALGWRHARRIGQASVADGRKQMLHWGAVLLVIGLAVLLGGSSIPPESLHTVILLLLTLGYVTVGLHLDRAFLWVGLLMGAGAVVVTVLSLYAWTAVGIMVALGLMVAGVRNGRAREATI